MHRDMHGLPISTASSGAAAAFDRTVAGYLKYRADLAGRLGETLGADGEFGLAHCLKGYFAMLSYKQANVPMAAEAARAARRLTADATARETIACRGARRLDRGRSRPCARCVGADSRAIIRST